jgi:hypothetical protein
MNKNRNSNGTFAFGHPTPEDIRNKISETLSKTPDLTGQRFGSWTALERRGIKGRVRQWFCRCDCGVEKEVAQRNLVNGRSTGCIKCAGKKNTERCLVRHQNENYHPGNGFHARWYSQVREKQLGKQNGICPICLKKLSLAASCFDHNHKTGKCRSLVHRGCNVFIGFVENHPGVCERVKGYLDAGFSIIYGKAR